MAGDDLYGPLGQGSKPLVGARRGRGLIVLLGCCAIVAAAGFGLIGRRAQVADRQTAVASIEPAKPAAAPVPASQEAAPVAASAKSGILSADDIDRQSGVKITRPNGSTAGSSTIIQVPQDLTVSLQRSPDPRLVEQSRVGLLPKRGADGSRPLEVYARPVVTDSTLPPNAPRIALVVGGMGLNAPLTAAAASELPPAVTLAFAPYGDVLEAQVQSARDAGHEALLQVPMESTGTPSAASMSHLLSGADDAKTTLDKLHWFMTRFTGYVGIANFLGATFTADAAALRPVLGDVAQRGLLYFDDGTAMRSRAPALAATVALPLVRADVVVDAVGETSAIDAALSKLEAQARDQGFAVGFASGLPLSIDRVASFARQLGPRGIALVPVSALATAGAARAVNQP